MSREHPPTFALEPATERQGEPEFLERLGNACALAERTGEVFAVHCFELEGVGGSATEEPLRQVWERVSGMIRRSDTLALVGDRQFALLQRDVKSTMGAITLIQKILDQLSEPFTVGGEKLEPQVSMGTTFHSEGAEPATLVDRAREALAMARAEAGRSYRFHRSDLEREVEAAVQAELRLAIEGDELFLEYQPQLDITTERVVGYEALVRWQHPRRGRVAPDQFIPQAEETGDILTLGWKVLVEACRQCKEWTAGVLPGVRVAVNVSAIQIRDTAFPRRVRTLLDDIGLSPALLDLELTETAFLGDHRALQLALLELSEMGIGLAIDDFGTGYSSLRYLRSLPVDRVKIAQEFVQGVVDEPKDAAIVISVIALCREMDFQALAEGVETRAQLAFLRQQECPLAQGFYFGVPTAAPGGSAPQHKSAPPAEANGAERSDDAPGATERE